MGKLRKDFRFSWQLLFRHRGEATDLKSTPIGDQGLIIDHWRGSVRIRRGGQAIVISPEELALMESAAAGQSPGTGVQGG